MQWTLHQTLRCCTTGVFLWCGDTMAWMQVFHVAGHSIHQKGLWTDYFGHLTHAKLFGTLQCLNPHVISDLVRAVTGTWVCCCGVNPFTLTSYQQIPLMGAVDSDTSSLSMTLFQLTASWIGQQNPASIHFAMWWHCSALPFPAGAYIQQNYTLISHSCIKPLKSLLHKAVSLSRRSLCNGVGLMNTTSSWRIWGKLFHLLLCFYHEGPEESKFWPAPGSGNHCIAIVLFKLFISWK